MTYVKTSAWMQQFATQQMIPDDKAQRLWGGLVDQPTPENNFYMDLFHPQWVLDAHNTREGRVFISGTGPSLASQEGLLKRLFTIEEVWTVNRAKWFFRDKLGLIPNCHLITEPGPIGQWGKIIWHPYDFPEVRNRIAIHWFPVDAPGWMWAAKAHDDVQVRWQGVVGMGETFPPLPTAWASPLTSVQLALWFGFTEIYMLGIDTTQDGQAWDVEAGRTANIRSVTSILECADRMQYQMRLKGRVIYDCTPNGLINREGVLPYRDLEDVLQEP
tara:strand:- start:10589 stop:11407 length:819 start_codon:yes stop_codon:yes gene_type:complete